MLSPGMALPITPKSLDLVDFEDEEDLSEEQMKTLLQRAEKRMEAAVTYKGSTEEVPQLHAPALAGNLDKYGDVATLVRAADFS